MTSIEIPDTGLAIEAELDQLLHDLLADDPDQPDATPEELDRLTEQLAEELAGLS